MCKRASISVPALISRFILPTYAASVRCFAERIFFEHIVTRISVPEAKCSAARFFNFSFDALDCDRLCQVKENNSPPG